jgi:uncharacterized protein (TIGR02231 family)
MKTPQIIISFSGRKKIAAIITGLVIMMSVTNIRAAITEKNIKSKIESVTVFTSGAQITRSSSVSVGSGTTLIVFEGLEPSIVPRSIQAGGTGNFIIMDVQHTVKYPEKKNAASPKNLRQIQLLEDSIVMLDFDMEELITKRDALNIEKNTLLNNRMIKGETKRDTLNLLKDAMVFLREKMANINSELFKLKKEEYRLNIKKEKMQNDLELLRNYNVNTGEVVKDETSYQVVVTVSSDAPASGQLTINYMLQNAGWSASYDLRAKGAGNSIQLTYKAQVFQNTGADWNDVKLTLSTANPNQSNVKPSLNTWWLSFHEQYYRPSPSAYHRAETTTTAKSIDGEADKSGVVEEQSDMLLQTIADYTSAQENIANVEYEIKMPYTIPSDAKAHFVAVQTKDITAEYAHFAAPKADKDAFLVAKITNWDELNLVSGRANIYFDNTYVGESYINSNNLTDTLDITLGRDKNMVVTREKQKDKTKEKIVGEDKLKTVTYEITVRNTKSSTSVFNLQDQIPVSQNKEVVVTLIEASGAAVNEDTGILSWKMNIKPKETKKVTITYSISFPKNKLIAGL